MRLELELTPHAIHMEPLFANFLPLDNKVEPLTVQLIPSGELARVDPVPVATKSPCPQATP
jgi:hypothetical protein